VFQDIKEGQPVARQAAFVFKQSSAAVATSREGQRSRNIFVLVGSERFQLVPSPLANGLTSSPASKHARAILL
jgi:hypothetical protein